MVKGESMIEAQVLSRFTIGEGLIDPDTRIQNGKLTKAEVDTFASKLSSNDYYKALESWKVPSQCVDGRANILRGANAAGGTTSLVIGDALTFGSYREHGARAPQHAKRMFTEIKKKDYLIGGHDEIGAHDGNCGCGAEDKLDSVDPHKPSVLRYIRRRGDDTRTFLSELRYTSTNELVGLEIPDNAHILIVDQAQKLQDEHYATNGAELRDAFIEADGEDVIETLEGEHPECVLIIDTRPKIGLKRDKIAQEYGTIMRAFYLNVASLQESAKIFSLFPEEAHTRFLGALYYNVATAAVLSGPSLRVIVL
jgi:hypothetical protein